MGYLSKCGPLRRPLNLALCNIRRNILCLDPRRWTGHAVALFLTTLGLGLSYMYGMCLLRLIFPDSWLKSTNTIVQEALAKYNADRLGRADYALESAGGSILCSSNTYYAKSGALYSLFGIPLWYHSSTPRMVIQPEIHPGTCWAMDRDQGHVTVQLAMPVVVTAVSLEHIPKELSPLGRLDSAPKEFVIMGQEVSVDSSEVWLGKFVYDINKTPIQMYDIKEPFCTASLLDMNKCGLNTRPYSIVTMKVISNHGHPDYTCIYRLRVHGKPFFLRNAYE